MRGIVSWLKLGLKFCTSSHQKKKKKSNAVNHMFPSLIDLSEISVDNFSGQARVRRRRSRTDSTLDNIDHTTSHINLDTKTLRVVCGVENREASASHYRRFAPSILSPGTSSEKWGVCGGTGAPRGACFAQLVALRNRLIRNTS
jgi:hypothetical protein